MDSRRWHSDWNHHQLAVLQLEEINRAKGKKHPWERQWSSGSSLMRIGALLRRTDMSLLDRWYAAIGHGLHTSAAKPHDLVVARRLLSDIGIDAAIFDAALDDPTTHDDVRADHQRVIDAGGFGVPRLFIEGQCLFGPVLPMMRNRLICSTRESLEFPSKTAAVSISLASRRCAKAATDRSAMPSAAASPAAASR